MRKPYLISAFVAVLATLTCSAQQRYLPLNNELNNRFVSQVGQVGGRFHTAVRPYLESDMASHLGGSDTLYLHGALFSIEGDSGAKIRYDKRMAQNGQSLFRIKTNDVLITIDPAFNYTVGRDIVNQERFSTNSRGFLMEGSIGDKFSFSSGFNEVQSFFPAYLDTFISRYQVTPGQGRVRPFKRQGYDYNMARGYISYSPSKHFNFQLGTDKHFIGDGYRSLLLSDNTYNYPFFKITTNIWKIKYVNLYAQFMDLNRRTDWNGFAPKFGSFHYLSMLVGKRMQIGLFEGIVWHAGDTSGYRGFDLNYLNPVIFYRPVEFSLGSPDNAIMGFNASYKLSSKMMTYGQFVLDDINISRSKAGGIGFFQNKFGYQFGMKSFDLFGLKNLYLQVEYNTVRPYTYSHKTLSQNYVHYNQALAHPLGANFREGLLIVRYRFKDILLAYEMSYAGYGVDSGSQHYGKDIFRSDFEADRYSFGNTTGQGVKTTLSYHDISAAWLIHERLNLQLRTGYIYRNETNALMTNNTGIVYIGLQTALSNFYFDF